MPPVDAGGTFVASGLPDLRGGARKIRIVKCRAQSSPGAPFWFPVLRSALTIWPDRAQLGRHERSARRELLVWKRVSHSMVHLGRVVGGSGLDLGSRQAHSSGRCHVNCASNILGLFTTS